MKVIGFLLHYSRGMVLLAIAAGLVSGASNTGLLAVINAALARSGSRGDLLLLFIGLCLVMPVARVSAELLLAHLGQSTILRMRMELSRFVLSVPLRRLEEIGPHRVLATLTDDIPAITTVVGTIPLLCVNAAVFLGALIYLAWLSWQVFAAVVVLIVLGVVGYQIPMLRGVRLMRQARALGDDLYHHFRALIDGAKELKLHSRRREAFLSGELETTARGVHERNLAGLKIFTIASSWGQLLVFVIIGLLVFALPELTRVDAKTLTGYALTLLYLMTPLQIMMNALPTFGRARVALERVEAMGLRLSAAAAGEKAAADVDQTRWESLDLLGVIHAYRREGQEGEFILGPIDLSLRPGELLFIAGGNGSGKTTLAKILTGLYVPSEGEIILDGRPITDENRESYRQFFSVVFSDFYVFRNLLGLDAPDLDSRASELMALLQLQHKVKVENGRLSTTDLSQGQRKRLALLTAYLEDRPIYLFDEWAADQDPYFREIFYRELLPSLKAAGKTAVVISHDDRYYGVGDRVVRLENGKVVAVVQGEEAERLFLRSRRPEASEKVPAP